MCTVRNLGAATLVCLLASAAAANQPPHPTTPPARASAAGGGTVGVAPAARPAGKRKIAYLGVVTSAVGRTLGRQLRLPEGTGLVVDFVVRGTAAENAGIHPHDVLTRLDDQILVNVPQLVVLMQLKKPGDKTTLTLVREGKARQVTAQLGETEPAAGAEAQAFTAQNAALAPLLNMVRPPAGGGPEWLVLKHLAQAAPSANARWVDGEHDLAITFTNRLDSDLLAARMGERMAHLNSALARYRQTLPETHPTIVQLREQIETLRAEMETRSHQPLCGRHLVAKDLLGNILFEGPIDTEAQLQAVPEPIRAKVRSMTPLVIFRAGAVPPAPKP